MICGQYQLPTNIFCRLLSFLLEILIVFYRLGISINFFLTKSFLLNLNFCRLQHLFLVNVCEFVKKCKISFSKIYFNKQFSKQNYISFRSFLKLRALKSEKLVSKKWLNFDLMTNLFTNVFLVFYLQGKIFVPIR